MNIRPFNPDVDYKTMEDIDKEIWPSSYETADELQFEDSTFDANYFHDDYIAKKDNKSVAYMRIKEAFWYDATDIYEVAIGVLPAFQKQGIGTALYDKAMGLITPRNSKAIIIHTKEDKPHAMRFLEQRGFAMKQREPASELDVQSFDSTPFDDKLTAVAASGINIYSWAKLRANDPNWEEKLWQIRWPIRKDIPSTEELTQLPFSDLKARLTNDNVPNINKNGCFIAIDGSLLDGDYVGYTFMYLSEGNPQRLFTGSTGVLRSHRRRGITTAMKVRAIQWAKAKGFEAIETDNDENNPMFGLNMQLGYKEAPAWLTYRREL